MRAQAGLNREPPAIHIAAPKPTPTADAHEQLYRWELLAILWGCLFLHQGGRQVYNSLIPLMRTDLSLTDVQLGLVASCFTLMYGMVAPFAGFLGDIWQRRFVIVLSLALFSLGNLLTGFIGGFASLVLIRTIANGVGEAAYYPVANAFLGQYHRETKAQALALHQTALYAGIVLSGWIGAWIGESHGWRSAFHVFGAGGLALIVVALARLRNDRSGRTPPRPEPRSGDESGVPLTKVSIGEAMRAVVRQPSIYLFSAAFGGMVFVNFGYTIWMPTFLHEKFALPLPQAALNATFYHFGAAVVGILVGARLGDRWSANAPRARVWLLAASLLGGAPFIALLAISDSLVLLNVALAMFGWFRGIYESNMFAALFDTVNHRYHSSAGGAMVACGFCIGAIAPVGLGWIKQQHALEIGWALLAAVFGLSGLLLVVGVRCIPSQPIAVVARTGTRH